MPIGKTSGFGYLGLLFFVAITAAGLAALGQAWSTAAERERERELQFRGNEIARAIASYVRASPVGQAARYPASFDDLIEDRRGIRVQHHLRKAYVDPFTLKPDWVLLPVVADSRAFTAVRSRSDQVMLRVSRSDGMPVKLASDWVFASSDYEGGSTPLCPAAGVLVSDCNPKP